MGYRASISKGVGAMMRTVLGLVVEDAGGLGEETMKHRNESPFDHDVQVRLENDPAYAAAYFEAIADEPFPTQIALLRRAYGISQEKIAAKLRLNQEQISRLERKGTDHLLGTYQKVARVLHSRIRLVPEGMKLVPT
jgi:ribosome-binding protein aMBF1 (putative translation factor)